MAVPLPDNEPTALGLLARPIIWFGGGHYKLARQCPPEDFGYFQRTALLYGAVFLYQTLVFSSAAHILFAPDGLIHASLISGSLLISTTIYAIDSYAFLLGGHYADGVAALKIIGGIDISGGIGLKFRALVYLFFRISFSVALSLLVGIWVSMIIFGDDIDAHLDAAWRAANSALIQTANVRIDARIQRETDALQISTTHLAALERQVDATQNSIVDPTAGDFGVEAEQAEFQELLKERASRDRELSDAEHFEADEIDGVKGLGHSGARGDGTIHRAAVQRLATAKTSDETAINALDAARSRLDELRSQAASVGGQRAGSAKALLPGLQGELQAEKAEVASQHTELVNLTDHRDQAVLAEIENAPDYVPRDRGMLARLLVLKEMARDPYIAAVIGLIGFASMCLELSAVIVKVTTYIPTSYCPLLARNAYLRVTQIADSMEAALRRKPPESHPDDDPDDDPLPPVSPLGNGGSDGSAGAAVPAPGNGLADDFIFRGAPLAKRPRGRPRKDRPN